jgi:hypothetical protein
MTEGVGFFGFSGKGCQTGFSGICSINLNQITAGKDILAVKAASFFQCFLLEIRKCRVLFKRKQQLIQVRGHSGIQKALQTMPLDFFI